MTFSCLRFSRWSVSIFCQADVREVVLLDRGAHALVDLLDLRKHLLRLCLLRRDGARRRICRCRRAQRRYAD